VSILDKVVIFGAGNIGRSFIASIFSSNGLHVIFVDVNKALVEELNIKKEYRIIIKRNLISDEELLIKNISAVHSSDTDKIMNNLAECSFCVTSVGQAALPGLIPVITKGIKLRKKRTISPLNIIIAENIRNGADYFRSLFKENGLNGNEAGLIETSIGKMVPIMSESDLKKDPLLLHAEEYNTLILDKKGFKNQVPDFPEIKAVENISAWVDRKLFIHNLGHVASAFLGFKKHPDRKLISEILEDTQIRFQVRNVMSEAAAALLCEYPSDFSEKLLSDHIDDLLFRFQNSALGDTVFRVGRDLSRKLGRDDRVLGAARLCLKYDLPLHEIVKIFYYAMCFKAADQNNIIFSKDVDFLDNASNMGIEKTLTKLCGLDSVIDIKLIKIILETDMPNKSVF
jgi:mannitol-1-phosphate 5-dehydrogenase